MTVDEAEELGRTAYIWGWALVNAAERAKRAALVSGNRAKQMRESVSINFGFGGRERVGKTDMEALNRGLAKLRTRIRIDPVQLI